MLAPSSSRVKIPGNPGILGSGAVAASPDRVSQVRYTCERFGSGWRFGFPHACDGVMGKVGSGEGGNLVDPCCLVPIMPTCRACVGACLIGAACFFLCWGSHCSLSFLDLQESNGGRQIAHALQDLVDLTRPCSWRLLPQFFGQELLAVLFFLFFLGTDF